MSPTGSPTPAHTVAQGYGNIYTPHAGSMVIQVQRELGLANRTIVLSPRKVRLLRFFTSRFGIALALMLAASWLVLAVQAVRVPLLTSRLRTLEHTAQRLDTLETTLSQLQARYNQVQRLLGPTSATQSQQQQATPTPATGAPASQTSAPVQAQSTPTQAPATAAPTQSPTPTTTAPKAAPAKTAPVKTTTAKAPVVLSVPDVAPPPPSVTPSPPTSPPPLQQQQQQPQEQ